MTGSQGSPGGGKVTISVINMLGPMLKGVNVYRVGLSNRFAPSTSRSSLLPIRIIPTEISPSMASR